VSIVDLGALVRISLSHGVVGDGNRESKGEEEKSSKYEVNSASE